MPLDSMRFCEGIQSMQDSKCFRSRERRVGSTPTISAKWGGKDGNVLVSCFVSLSVRTTPGYAGECKEII